MNSLLKVCTAAALALCAASTATQASTITATWTGSIRDDAVDSGDFGAVPPGAGTIGSLPGGTAFTLTSVFDTSTYSTPGAGIVDQLTGGSATLSINGHDVLFNQSPATFQVDQYGSLKLFIGDTANTFLSMSFYSGNPFTSVLTLPGSQGCNGVPADGYCSGSFEIVPGYSGATLVASQLDVAKTPIPATLPLLASGIGGLGFAGWRRRKMAA
jgi:hypothetical protein